ncbi:TetR family transcriptional regulator [Longimycelium tulufanense]|uniref:TetR family transcriptional regulator n=2 Tax=Longimycelium tulufanense TaxID=907463 RepID=A0A8J3CEL9_9PSEU|nr:TetR family transcriptional regulator [Longimycelium tulufanense]
MEYSESTRQALVDSAIALFTERGYGGTSLDEIAHRARVTKGALYHHFANKQALFEAAYQAVEADVVDRLAEVMRVPTDLWDAMKAGIAAFFEVCLEPNYQRIALQEAPSVLGYDRWRLAEEHSCFSVVRTGLEALIDAGEIEDLPLEAASRIVFGALAFGAIMIAGADDPVRTREDVVYSVDYLVDGLRHGAAYPRDTEQMAPDPQD